MPLLEYHLLVLRRTWRGGVGSRVLLPALTLLSLGVGLGALVDRAAGGVPWLGHTVPYLDFVVPAVLASTAMMTAVGDSAWPVMGAIKWQGTYHAMLATPARTIDILRAHLVAVGLQLGLLAVCFVGTAWLFGSFRSWWALLTVPTAMLTGLAFGTWMTALAARTETEAAFTMVFRLGVMPLMLFSGTYFPVEQLPAALRPLAQVTPLWHGVEACRAIGLGLVDPLRLAGHLLVLLVFAGVGALVAAQQLRRRLVT